MSGPRTARTGSPRPVEPPETGGGRDAETVADLLRSLRDAALGRAEAVRLWRETRTDRDGREETRAGETRRRLPPDRAAAAAFALRTGYAPAAVAAIAADGQRVVVTLRDGKRAVFGPSPGLNSSSQDPEAGE